MHLAAFLLSAVLLQATPAATTGAAESITTGSAAVTGTVNPNGEATTYQFEYGTTTSYGLTTPQQDAGSGSTAASVRATLSNLTQSTTYHYRLVATNTGDPTKVDRGADRTLRTNAPASAPSISSRSSSGVNSLGATLNARVNPRGLATSVRFEYGTSTSYGTSTPEQPIGAGSSTVAVTAALGGLKPGTKYNYRAVATSAAGIARSSNSSFTTSKAPTGVAITPSTIRPIWGSGLTITGTVSGATSIPVALEKQDFPYTGGFGQIATANASSKGAFTLTAPPLFTTARLRVVTRTAVVAVSPVTTASVAVKVGLKTKRLKGKRLRVEGATWPAVQSGRISLQRQSKTGKWGFLKRTKPELLTGNRSRYRFIIARRARATNYRIVVLARDGGAHVPGTSRTLTVPAR
jgi:hypothetical protein